MDLDKPPVIPMAFTASAAKNINGETIHGALRMNPQAPGQPMSDSDLQKMRDKMKQTELIIIDEVSMLGTNLNHDIDECLNHITGKDNLPYGGLNMIFVGDLLQLKPITDNYIFQKAEIKGRCNNLAPNIWKVHARQYKLTEKMRSADDAVLGELADATAIDELTEAQKVMLKSRVLKCPEVPLDMCQKGEMLIIVLDNEKRSKINRDFMKKLIPDEEQIIFIAEDKYKDIKGEPPTEKLANAPFTKTGILPSKLPLKIGALVIITTNVYKMI